MKNVKSPDVISIFIVAVTLLFVGLWLFYVFMTLPKVVEIDLDSLGYTNIEVERSFLSLKCMDDPSYTFTALDTRKVPISGTACHSLLFGNRFYFD